MTFEDWHMLLIPNLAYRYFAKIEVKVNKCIHHLLEEKNQGAKFWVCKFFITLVKFYDLLKFED